MKHVETAKNLIKKMSGGNFVDCKEELRNAINADISAMKDDYIDSGCAFQDGLSRLEESVDTEDLAVKLFKKYQTHEDWEFKCKNVMKKDGMEDRKINIVLDNMRILF